MNLILPDSFRGPAQYFSEEAIKAAKQDFLGERHIEMVYATLVAWGMHRSGNRGAKMPEFQHFKDSIVKNKETLNNLKDTRIECLHKIQFDNVVKKIEYLCFDNDGICASKTKSKLVSSTKALAHILPNLVPPIDREYTARFFNYTKNLSQEKEKELFNEVMLTVYLLFQDNLLVSCAKSIIKRKFNENFSLPKLFDYIIVNTISNEKTSRSTAHRTELCGICYSILKSYYILFVHSHCGLKTKPNAHHPLGYYKRVHRLQIISFFLYYYQDLDPRIMASKSICPLRAGLPRARGFHPRLHQLGPRHTPEVLLDQIPCGALRQPRGQCLRLRRLLFPFALFRGRSD